MLKMIDLIRDLLLFCYSAWFPNMSFEVEDGRGGVSESFSSCHPFVSCYLNMQVLELMDSIIEEVERSMSRPPFVNFYVFVQGPLPQCSSGGGL
jgi:hypothetical protein